MMTSLKSLMRSMKKLESHCMNAAGATGRNSMFENPPSLRSAQGKLRANHPQPRSASARHDPVPRKLGNGLTRHLPRPLLSNPFHHPPGRAVTPPARGSPPAGLHRLSPGGKTLEGTRSVSYRAPTMATAASDYEGIEKDALHLSQDERSKLVSKLLECLLDEGDDFEIGPKWREELRRRVQGIDEGLATLIPHEEVMERVKARLEEIRRQKSS